MTVRYFAATILLVLALQMPWLSATLRQLLRHAPVSAAVPENIFHAITEDIGWVSGFNLPGMNDNVYAMAVGRDGSIYAGGAFTTAGEVAANSVARWDGAHWHPLGSGMGGCLFPTVWALTLGPDGSLYAGGSFPAADGVIVNNIARWDATTSSWHPLSSGMDGDVQALAFGSDGSLYAG